MKSSLPEATKEQRKRWQQMQATGCVACCLDGMIGNPGDIHHLLSGGKRISHWHSVCLCSFHHRNVLKGDHHNDTPSLASEPKKFRERYGNDQELLAAQNAILQHYCEVTNTNEHHYE